MSNWWYEEENLVKLSQFQKTFNINTGHVYLVLSHWAHVTVHTAYMLYYCEHCGVDLMGLKPNP